MPRSSDLFSNLRRNWKSAVGWGLGLALPLFSAFVADNWWLLVWGVGPLLFMEVLPWPSWRFLRGTGYKQPSVRTLWLVTAIVFLVVFTGLAFLPGLNHQTPLLGYEDFTHRNWLNLGWLDDPTYRLARKAPVGHRLVVVTVREREAGETISGYRYNLLDTIVMAYKNDATGVGMDFYFTAEDPQGDKAFSEQIESICEASGGYFRVFVGYDIRHFDTPAGQVLAIRAPARTLVDETMARRGYEDIDPGWTDPEDGEPGVPEDEEKPHRGFFAYENHGHVYAFTESNGKVRSLPIGFSGRASQPALSVRIAEHIRRVQGRLSAPSKAFGKNEEAVDPKPLRSPPGGLLYFVPPRTPLLHLHAEDFPVLDETGELAELLRGRFVLIGTEGGGDVKRTPFHKGEIPGVFLHAYATEALIGQHWIVRCEWWYALLGAILPILSMATRFSRRRALRGIVLSNVAFSMMVVAVSGVIIVLSNVWIDVSYVLIAIWAFLLIGIAIQRVEIQIEARRSAAAARKVDTQGPVTAR